MNQALVESWLVNCATTLLLLDMLTPDQWDALTEKGKPIRAQFAHLHNVRLMWVKMSDKVLLGVMEQADRRKGSREEIRAALVRSAEAIARVLQAAESAEGKVKGFARTSAAFLTGACAHEGYHRGQIELILRQNGMELDEEKMLKVWDYPHVSKLAQDQFSSFFT